VNDPIAELKIKAVGSVAVHCRAFCCQYNNNVSFMFSL
jgi:hypothetical protein